MLQNPNFLSPPPKNQLIRVGGAFNLLIKRRILMFASSKPLAAVQAEMNDAIRTLIVFFYKETQLLNHISTRGY
jgi:hypothetical protein